MEDGIGLCRLDDSTHDILVGQGEELGGDSMHLVSARLALLYTVLAQLSSRARDEDFHSNPPFLWMFRN